MGCFPAAVESITKPWSTPSEIQAPAGLPCFHASHFHPIVVILRLTQTLPDFQELERLIEDGAPTTFLRKKKQTVSSFTHGCVFFSWGISGRCDGLRCRTLWRVVSQRRGARSPPCKVVKVVSLEVFFCCCRHYYRLRVAPACRLAAIMARRTGERSAALTPTPRATFRDKHLQFHRGLLAFSWSFVLISALSCGFCDAETEFSILEEAQVLADQMKKLSSQELGVFTMQVKEKGMF